MTNEIVRKNETFLRPTYRKRENDGLLFTIQANKNRKMMDQQKKQGDSDYP